MEANNYRDLLLSVQQALLGEVGSSLRGVAVEWQKNKIIIYFYNEGLISDDLRDDYSCVGTEVIADFPDAIIREEIIRIDTPHKLPSHDFWAFRKRENN